MIDSRSVTRFAILVSLGIAASAAAQEPKATPAPDQPAAAQGSPEETLKGLLLKRTGTTWILSDETSVLKDIRDARDLYRRVAQGMMNQQQVAAEAGRQKMEMGQLREQSSLLQQQVTQYDQQLAQTPGGNPLYDAQRDQLNNERNQVVGALNQLNNRLNQLEREDRDKDRNRDQDPALLLNAEVSEAREKYMQSVYDLRKSVDALLSKYSELAKKPEVNQALEAISASTKSKHRLGPSKPLLEAIKQLEKAEGSVQSDSITLHKESGVYHLYANLNKVPTKMVFDTGAGLTTISAKLAQKIGVKPLPTDQPVTLKTADGTEIQTKIQTIPSIRVGKFSVANVECAVMPEDKGDVDPLLGQSFFKHFNVDFRPDAGRLSLKRLQTETDAENKAVAGSGTEFGSEPSATAPATGKGTTKGRKPARPSRPTLRGKKPATPKAATPAGSSDGAEPAPN
ncbi:retropepsin-like aspartic protease [Aquisphaera insulae]|uniref:retropepsin-like aspartic protease n=1 Tax=Aquisphaera insulae TaxID=2712864 RepID=UPI0013EAC27F|nr:retropepsin-like aspartic protease [Aquisphaera insulae]